MNLSEIVANVKQHFDELDILEGSANKAIELRDAARVKVAKVLDDAIAGLQVLRDGLHVPKETPVAPADPANPPQV